MQSVNAHRLFLAVALVAAFNVVNAHEDYKHVLEADQQRLVLMAWGSSPWLAGDELRVAVHEGKASLNGKVGHPVASDLAAQLALAVEGINKVDNRIVVVMGYKSPLRSASSSVSEMRGDENVSAHKQPLQTEPSSLANVETSARWGVADVWITAKVKSALIYSGNVDSSDIAVRTNSGIVTLRGSVSGGAEHALAIVRAKNIQGVRSVDAAGFVNRSDSSNPVAQASY